MNLGKRKLESEPALFCDIQVRRERCSAGDKVAMEQAAHSFSLGPLRITGKKHAFGDRNDLIIKCRRRN